MKLISLSDFVLQQDELIRKKEINPYQFTMYVTDYALFLQRPLTLDMFVPCDENNNILQEPTDMYNTPQYYEATLGQYLEAKNKILFKGLEFEQNTGKEKSYFDIIKSIYPTIGSLVDFEDVSLTERAVKQIGLS